MIKKSFVVFSMLMFSLSSFASDLPNYPFIHSTGYAYINVAPDHGEIAFELSVIDADPARAFTSATERLAEIRALLVQMELNDADVVIRDLKKRVIERVPGQGVEAESVEISCDVNIKVLDLSKWQGVLQPLLKMPNLGKLVSSFDISTRTQIELDLAGAAIHDARRKATALASEAGKRLGDAKAISEERIKNLTASVGLVTANALYVNRDMRSMTSVGALMMIPALRFGAAIDVIFEMRPKLKGK